VRTHFDNQARAKRQRLADLEDQTTALERQLFDARRSLDQERARAAEAWGTEPDDAAEMRDYDPDDFGPEDIGPDDLGEAGFAAADFGPADFAGADYQPSQFQPSQFQPSQLQTAQFQAPEFGRAGFGPHGGGPEPRGSADAADFDLETDDEEYDEEAGAYPDPGAGLPAAAPMPLGSYAAATPRGHVYAPEARTAILVNRGRSTAPRRLSRGAKIAAGALGVVALLITLVVMMLPGPGPTWPASVARVQGEIAKACQNPDVRSEPGQVNFACAKGTRQILWVFSLLTSGDDPTYAEAATGRVGLEPITPTQGGAVALSLNLHHPYDPSNPVDSLQVAARAINDIIGGATVTGSYGNPVVQAGLEGSAANCLRYTGSAKVTRHKGFPGLCARPVSSLAGQAELVADVYQRWVVGAAPKAAQNATILYENYKNPGTPQVQAILKHLPNSER
jgi:hypothetical protein